MQFSRQLIFHSYSPFTSLLSFVDIQGILFTCYSNSLLLSYKINLLFAEISNVYGRMRVNFHSHTDEKFFLDFQRNLQTFIVR